MVALVKVMAHDSSVTMVAKLVTTLIAIMLCIVDPKNN